jgi:dienelactone hydrolase
MSVTARLLLFVRRNAFRLCVLLAGVACVARPAWALGPEERGAFGVDEWDAGAVVIDGVSLKTRVFFPDAPGRYPVVGVIHGASANGSYHPELASTLASRGMVVVVPDMPCTVISCDHARNSGLVLGLLDWVVGRSDDPASPLAGLADPDRRGLIGHSWGGLTSHLAASTSDTIDSLVLLDPNDDLTEGQDAAAAISAPTLQLIAENEGACNSMWREATIRERLVVPNLQVTLNGSGHCNPGEVDLVCSLACGSGDTATTPIFRRYAVAWTACALLGDEEMATWLGGEAYTNDVANGVLERVFAVDLAALPCQTGGVPVADPEPDAGPADAGPALDAETDVLDAGEVDPVEDVSDAAAQPTPDAESPERDTTSADGPADVVADSGDATPHEREAPTGESGCAAAAPLSSASWVLVFTALVLGHRRVRQRRRDGNGA